ncbi:MAG TPA: trigger factor [Candidatus Sumerlaeota bacterium]|nr:trigger factor [Candidatus Sumerlaeota bacterium]
MTDEMKNNADVNAPEEAGADAASIAPANAQDPAEAPPADKSADTAAETKERIPHEVIEAQDLEGSVRSWKIRVEWGILEERLNRMLKDLQKTVVIDGFRKGKAPSRIIRVRYRKEIDSDIVEDIAALIMAENLEKEGRTACSQAVVDHAGIQEGQPLEFVAKTEIVPRPELKKEQYTGLEVSIPRLIVTDEMVDEQLKQLQERNTTFEPREEGVVEEGDAVVVNSEALDAHGHSIPVCKKTNELIEDPKEFFPPQVYAKVIGASKGDVIEVKISPEPEDKDLWKAEILEIKKVVVPALDDDFARDLGDYENLDALRARIRENLSTQAQNNAREKAISDILSKVNSATSFEIPGSLVQDEMRERMKHDFDALASMGISPELVIRDKAKYLAAKQSNATGAVRARIILDAVIQTETLAVSDEDLERAIAEIAEKENRKPLAVRARLEAEEKLDGFRESLLMKKVEDFLIANNAVKFEDLTREQMMEKEKQEAAEHNHEHGEDCGCDHDAPAQDAGPDEPGKDAQE